MKGENDNNFYHFKSGDVNDYIWSNDTIPSLNMGRDIILNKYPCALDYGTQLDDINEVIFIDKGPLLIPIP